MIKRLRYLLLYILLIPNISQAQADIGLGKIEGIKVGKEKKPGTVVSAIINTLLGLLGLFATIIILLGGFKWMTAQGSAEKVTEAKDLIKNGIIGLVIIILSYSIASFVISKIYESGDGTQPVAGGSE